ncbi:hypothetical protein DER46DRAFT_367748 [Fusarium sp. MPI-SDFR-AT-0072]|nr:hypothetical protein DER46DRAFT_367748 [Fusarium sp. MPI-SDFR-AT-0072]
MRRIDITASHSFWLLAALLIEILSKTSTHGIGFCFSSVPVYRQYFIVLDDSLPDIRKKTCRLFAFTVLSLFPLVASLSPFACHAISAGGCGYVSRCNESLQQRADPCLSVGQNLGNLKKLT